MLDLSYPMCQMWDNKREIIMISTLWSLSRLKNYYRCIAEEALGCRTPSVRGSHCYTQNLIYACMSESDEVGCTNTERWGVHAVWATQRHVSLARCYCFKPCYLFSWIHMMETRNSRWHTLFKQNPKHKRDITVRLSRKILCWSL